MKTKKRLINICNINYNFFDSKFNIWYKNLSKWNTIALKNIEALAYEETIKASRPAKIQAFAKKLLGQGNRIEVVMEP